MISRLQLSRRVDEIVAVSAVGLLGTGVVAALAFEASGRDVAAVSFALAALAALVVLLAGDWIPTTALVVAALPLPVMVLDGATRLSPAAIVTAAALLAWVINRSSRGVMVETGSVPRTAAFAVLAAVAVSGLFADSPILAARELLSWVLLLGLLFVATDLFIERPTRIEPVLIVQAVMAAFVGGLAVLQMLGIIPGAFQLERTTLNRASLSFDQPNGLGMLLAISLPLSIHVAREARSRLGKQLAWGGAVACGLGLIATFSRGSWLAFVGSALLLAMMGERRLAIRIILYSVAVITIANIALDGAIFERLARTAQDGMIFQRLASTYAGVLMFVDNPLVGVGPGGFAEGLEAYGPEVTTLNEYVGSAHNGYVQMGAETGLLGFLALFGFILAAYRMLLPRGVGRRRGTESRDAREIGLRRSLSWSFGVFFLLGFAEWPLTHGIGELVMIVLAIGASLGGSARTHSTSQTKHPDASSGNIAFGSQV